MKNKYVFLGKQANSLRLQENKPSLAEWTVQFWSVDNGEVIILDFHSRVKGEKRKKQETTENGRDTAEI